MVERKGLAGWRARKRRVDYLERVRWEICDSKKDVDGRLRDGNTRLLLDQYEDSPQDLVDLCQILETQPAVFPLTLAIRYSKPIPFPPFHRCQHHRGRQDHGQDHLGRPNLGHHREPQRRLCHQCPTLRTPSRPQVRWIHRRPGHCWTIVRITFISKTSISQNGTAADASRSIGTHLFWCGGLFLFVRFWVFHYVVLPVLSPTTSLVRSRSLD